MKLTCAGTKNSPTYYVQKSIRKGNKTTTKTIERLGSIEEIKARCGDRDPIEWAREYTKKLTLKENEDKQRITLNYSPSTLIEKNERHLANVGYLFLQDIYYSLGINKICSEISERHKFDFDLNDILSMLVYARILSPMSKRSSLDYSKKLLEASNAKLHQVYRALEVISDENDYIQSQIYKNSQQVIARKKGILYYDCTNYYFEIEKDDDFRKYGVSKEHRPNPIVQMGLFMDADGIPLSFSLFNGNENEQSSMTPLEEKIISDYGIDQFVVCTDAGLSSAANRKFNDKGNRKFVTTQSIKKLKGFLQDFCLDEAGWHLEGSSKSYNLSELDEESDFDKTFYKDRWINENGLEQHLIVTFSLKHKHYQQNIREAQLERASKLVSSPSRLKKKSPNDPRRFITETRCTSQGEIAEKSVTYVDESIAKNEEKYDGFYAVCTNLEDKPSTIIRINNQRWEIEECFRIMKSEFKARPVYLSRKDRINAHFTTCFIALILYRILEKKLQEKYTCESIIRTLKNMNMLICPGEGYIPAYTRTQLTDDLHEEFNFRTDYEIISQRNMKKICTKTKKSKIATKS